MKEMNDGVLGWSRCSIWTIVLGWDDAKANDENYERGRYADCSLFSLSIRIQSIQGQHVSL